MALTGKTNAEKIWNYFIQAGISEFGAAGLMGNLFAESGLIPTNLQNSCEDKYTDMSYTAAVDNGSYTKDQFSVDRFGYGICQWTHHKRKMNLYNFAKTACKSIGDLEMQLNFLMKELSESYPDVLNVLMTATSVRAASDVVLIEFERPSNSGNDTQTKRAGFGQKYYTEFVTNKQIGGCNEMAYVTIKKGRKTTLSDHFKSTEFDCHGKGCCSETLINEQLVDYLERIRKHFGKPITVTSGYRCSVHNQNVGGAKNSRHSKGDAADIKVKDVSPKDVAAYAESIGVLGIGLYDTDKDGHFTHIDTRSVKSFWFGHAQEKRTTFIEDNNKHDSTQGSVVLRPGDKGDAVKTLQENLTLLGYSCGSNGVDGVYGSKTENAVMQFQAKNGLAVDGIAGRETLTLLDKLVRDRNKKVKVTVNILNVRSGAGTQYKIIGKLKRDTERELIEEMDGWGRISNPDGWISLQHTIIT